MTASDYDRYRDLQRDVERSVRYHARRTAFFESSGRISDGTAAVLSSAAVGAIVGQLPQVAAIGAAFVAVVSTFDLVVGTSNMARKHDGLRRRYIALEIALPVSQELTVEQEGKYRRRFLQIERDEPTVYEAVDALCHNDVLRAEGYGSDHPNVVQIPVYKRLTAHLVRWHMETR